MKYLIISYLVLIQITCFGFGCAKESEGKEHARVGAYLGRFHFGIISQIDSFDFENHEFSEKEAWASDLASLDKTHVAINTDKEAWLYKPEKVEPVIFAVRLDEKGGIKHIYAYYSSRYSLVIDSETHAKYLGEYNWRNVQWNK